jgi:hypothetical protein
VIITNGVRPAYLNRKKRRHHQSRRTKGTAVGRQFGQTSVPVLLHCHRAEIFRERVCNWNGIDYSYEWPRALLLDLILYQSQDAAAQACARTKVTGHLR